MCIKNCNPQQSSFGCNFIPVLLDCPVSDVLNLGKNSVNLNFSHYQHGKPKLVRFSVGPYGCFHLTCVSLSRLDFDFCLKTGNVQPGSATS